MRHSAPRAPRGAATVEFALVVPLLVIILMFSMYLAELVRAKIKLQEVVRYSAWEMTSYVLSDFANFNHDAAFTDASNETLAEARTRYQDLNSVEDNAGNGNFVARFTDVQLDMVNKDILFLDPQIPLGSDPGEDGDLAQAALNGANATPAQLLNQWSFNQKGWVRTDATMRFNTVLIPTSYLDQGPGAFFDVDTFGGYNIASLPLRARYSLYANGWNMPDGSDATMRDRRAGVHRGGNADMPHGLHRQVSQMTFLGVRGALDMDTLGIAPAVDDYLFPEDEPEFQGTFVVSHGYGTNPSGPWDRECVGHDGMINYPSPNNADEDARAGLNNLMKSSELDNDLPRCFDTAPFRDHHSYDDSLYLQIFRARGEFFMGCKRPQADDPASPNSADAVEGDGRMNVVNCE
jgi:hypothetical protein